MPTWLVIMIIALGGAMLLEGAVYALFPGGMKRAMREIMDMPENQLRAGGLIIAMLGLTLVVLLLRNISG